MKRLILLALLCSVSCLAEERKLWKWSVVALAASTAADCHSSFGMREANPLLRPAGHRFGAGSVALKAGVVGALLVGQKLLFPGRAKNTKTWTVVNFSMAATTAGFAVHNYRIR
jgi:hypothetical protein